MPLADSSTRYNTGDRLNRWGRPALPLPSNSSSRKSLQPPSSFVSSRFRRYEITKAHHSAQSSGVTKHGRKSYISPSKNTVALRPPTRSRNSPSQNSYWASPDGASKVDWRRRRDSYSTWNKPPLSAHSQMPSKDPTSISCPLQSTPEHTVSRLNSLDAVSSSPPHETDDRHDSLRDTLSTTGKDSLRDTPPHGRPEPFDSITAQSCSSTAVPLS